MKITTKFASVMLLSLIFFLVAVYLITQEIYVAELKNTARVAADNVSDVGTWASQYGQVWAKDGGKSTHLFKESLRKPKADSLVIVGGAVVHTPTTGESAQDIVEYFGKNPALVQREFADVVAKSEARVKFRLTSDNFMNPKNAPDDFESAAIAKIKRGKFKEYGRAIGSEYRYMRAIFMKETCLKCHGSPESAPARVVELYGRDRGYGYKAGDLAGVISVKVPADFSLRRFYSDFNTQNYIALSFLLVSILIPFLYVSISIIGRIKRLTETAELISMGESSEVDIVVNERSSDELDKLAAAVKRISRSFHLAVQQIKSKK